MEILIRILSSKWMHLACCFINSIFASVTWQTGDYVIAVAVYCLAFYCGLNFVRAVKEDYYDQDE